MTQLQSKNLFHVPFPELLTKIKNEIPVFEYDFSKHLIRLENESAEELGFLRLPLHLSINNELSILKEDTKVLYLSIESGYAAISLMGGKENIYHSTFSAYMTRKKQGFSQIKYLNKKGKSRAGSRVRLAATVEFFENINRKSQEIMTEHRIERIALNCNSTLIPYLFQSKIPPPFEKKDPRLYKIPLHIPQSNFTNLDAAIKKLMAPVLFYEIKKENEIEEIFTNNEK